MEWLVEPCHISWDIDDTCVCFFNGVDYSCRHLAIKNTHDDWCFLICWALQDLSLFDYIRLDDFFQELTPFIFVWKMFEIRAEAEIF